MIPNSIVNVWRYWENNFHHIIDFLIFFRYICNIRYYFKSIVVDTFFIEQTYETPKVQINFVEGVFSIKGRVIPEEVDTFWSGITENVFKIDTDKELTVKLKIDYLNISSSKKLLYLLYDLEKTYKKIKVMWYYEEYDEDMYEVGRDYEHMVSIPFIFKKKKQKMLEGSGTLK